VAIKESNLEIVVDCSYEGNLDSIMVFWSFEPCIENFKYCRPFISVDKIQLYEWYNEKLLIAIAFYANNKIFLLAFAIIDEENNDNWRWLFPCLQRYITSGKTYVYIISCRHQRWFMWAITWINTL